MDNPPPSPGRRTDRSAIQIEKRDEEEAQDQVKIEASSSKLGGKKRRAHETQMIVKKKVKKMEAKAAHMRAESRHLRAANGEMEAAAEEKEKEVKLLKEKRDGCLAEMLLMSVTERLLLTEILFPTSNDY